MVGTGASTGGENVAHPSTGYIKSIFNARPFIIHHKITILAQEKQQWLNMEVQKTINQSINQYYQRATCIALGQYAWYLRCLRVCLLHYTETHTERE